MSGVNQLVAATRHNVPDGTQVDFLGTKGSYAAFLKTMIGLELLITARSEEYQVNGETKKTLRIKNMREVPIAEVDADDIDPKPF